MTNMKKQLGIVDSRSRQGILVRGKNRYNGSGTSPNPAGINSSQTVKLGNERRKNLVRKSKTITPQQAKIMLASRKKVN